MYSRADRRCLAPADAVRVNSASEKSNVPVDVGIVVLGLLECMGNVALSHSQGMTHQAGNQIPIAVVANDEVWVVAVSGSIQFSLDSFCGV